jgi:hypothetical protein
MNTIERIAENLAISLLEFTGNYSGSPYKEKAEKALAEYNIWVSKGLQYAAATGSLKDLEKDIYWFLCENEDSRTVQSAEVARMVEAFLIRQSAKVDAGSQTHGKTSSVRVDPDKVMRSFQEALESGLSQESAVGQAILSATQQMWSQSDLDANSASILCSFSDLWKELSLSKPSEQT